MILTPDSYSYEMWKQLPPELPMYMKVYFFNLTNPEAVQFENKPPRFEEVGPYVYQEFHLKVNETWNPENDTVTFMQNKWWEFKPEQSVGDQSDLIVTINIIAVVSVFKDLADVRDKAFERVGQLDNGQTQKRKKESKHSQHVLSFRGLD